MEGAGVDKWILNILYLSGGRRYQER